MIAVAIYVQRLPPKRGAEEEQRVSLCDTTHLLSGSHLPWTGNTGCHEKAQGLDPS
jgi:hypothetical protein